MVDKNRPAVWILLIGLLLVGAGLRFYQIAAKDIWLDEANTVAIASAEPGAMIDRLKLDSSPPLYYLLLHFWIKLFGDSEAAVRSLSSLFGIALACVIYLVARRMFGPETAVFAGLLAALSPVQIMYSQETRMYALLPLLSLLAFYFFLKHLEDRRMPSLALAALFTGLAIYTHNFSFFLLPVQLAMLLIKRSPRCSFIGWSLSLVSLFLLYLPWLPVLLFQIRNDTNYAWIAQVWRAFGFFGAFFQTFKSFSAAGDHAKYLDLASGKWIALFSIAVMVAAAVLGILMDRKAKPSGSMTRFFHCLAFLFLPLLLAGFGSLLFRPIYVAGRTDQLVFPAFCLALAFLIALVRPRPLKYLILAAMLGLSLYTLKDYYRTNYKTGDRRIAEIIRGDARSGDAVVFTDLTRASVEYYLRRTRPGLSIFSYPEEIATHMGNIHHEKMLKNPARLKSDADTLAYRIMRAGFRRVYLVFAPGQVDDFLRFALEEKLPIKDAILLGRFRQSLIKTKIDLYRIELELKTDGPAGT